MQDNSNLADRGWKAMHTLLEGKMPVKRYSILFWWVLFGISISILIGGYYFLQKMNPNSDNSLYQAVYVESPNNTIDSVSAHHATEIIELMDDHREIINQQSSEIIPLYEITKIETPPNQNQIPNSLEKNKEKAFNHLTTIEEGNQGSILSKTKPYNSNFIVAAIQNLPKAKISEFKVQQHDFKSIFPQVKIKSDSPNRLHFDLNAIVHNSLYNIPGGLELGIGVSYQMNKKWNMYTGLRFARYFREGYDPIFQFSNKTTTDSYFEEANNLDYINYDKSFASYEETVPLVDQLEYIQIPLLIRYSVRPRWQLGAGTRFAYLLNGSNETGNNNAVNSALQDGLGVNGILYKNEYYHKFDLAYTIEFRYRMSRKWFLGMQFNNGILNILDVETIQGSTRRKDVNKDLGISLTYTF